MLLEVSESLLDILDWDEGPGFNSIFQCCFAQLSIQIHIWVTVVFVILQLEELPYSV